MNEFDPLHSFLLKAHSFTTEEADFFVAHFSKRRVKKKQFIVQPDFVAKSRVYVLEGAFRAFVLDKNGIEHTISLAIDGWWITDPDSFLFQQPATMYVEALENSVILELNYDKEELLKADSHKFESFFRKIAEIGLAHIHRRLMASHIFTAEERYDCFAERYTSLNERMPQYVIASYLGMTTEYLSRIRKNKLKS